VAKPIPDGYRTVTPYITVRNAADAIEFYKRAFGAQERERLPGPDGKSIMHAELKIGDSIIMLSDELPQSGTRAPQSLGGSTGYLFLYVPDVDTAFKRALGAGATVAMSLADMFWGDRFGKVADPFGHVWGLATHKEDLAPEEIGRRHQEFMAKMGRPQPGPAKASQQKPGPPKASQPQPGPAKASQQKPGLPKASPAKAGPAKAGPAKAGPPKASQPRK
jgi:uncharacterized glyoxalase superfamily protein PhnB